MRRTTVLCLFLLLPSVAHAGPNPLGALVNSAEAVFIGRVADQSTGWSHGAWVTTMYEFGGVDWLKGGTLDDRYVVAVEGGVYGDRVHRVDDFPGLELGREYIVFLSGNGTAPLPFVGGSRGILEVEPTMGACVAGADGTIWSRSIRGGLREVKLPTGRMAAANLLDAVAGYRSLVTAEELVDAVRELADFTTVLPITTLTFGDFDAYQPG